MSSFVKPLRFPPDIQKHFPPLTLSVREFLEVNLPPVAVVTTRAMRTQKYHSDLPPTSESVDEIMSLLSPPDDILATLQQSIRSGTVKSIQCPHFQLETASEQRYPLWIVSFWVQLAFVRKRQENWRKAIEKLKIQMERNQNSSPLRKAFNSLAYVPWTGQLQGVRDTIEVHELSLYFTRDWLTDDHELVMLSMLKKTISTEGNNCFVENTAFMTLLAAAYDKKDEYGTEHAYGWIRKRGEDLASCQKRYLATVANQDNTHWVALIVDFESQELLYGDSFGHPISADMHAVIDWWTHYHTNSRFTVRTLPISRQQDSFSCGMLAWDALRHRLASGAPNLMDPQQPFHERADMFLQLTMAYHKDKVSQTSTYREVFYKCIFRISNPTHHSPIQLIKVRHHHPHAVLRTNP